MCLILFDELALKGVSSVQYFHFSEAGNVLKVLRSGDFFGEIGLLSLDAGQNR